MAKAAEVTKPVMLPKREATDIASAASGAIARRKSRPYWRLVVIHMLRSAGRAGLAARMHTTDASRGSGARKVSSDSHISSNWRVLDTPVVRKYSPTPERALLSPSLAAVKKPQKIAERSAMAHVA